MKAGPKSAAVLDPLPWKPRSTGAEQLRLFAKKYLKVPRGKGARSPFVLRPWQVETSKTLLDDDKVRLAVWVIPRGNGKSGIAAAIGLHHVFMSGIEGARCAVVAQDERSANRLMKTAARMVELDEELSARAVIYRDRIEIPGSDSVFMALPGEAHRVEGEDLTLAIVDEIGFVKKDTFEATILSAGKREGSKVLAIGTPSPAKWRDVSPLWDLVVRGRSEPDAPDFRLVEFGADPDLPIDSPETWKLANPAFGDWLTEDAIRAQLPPTTREIEFRRARLGQWVEQSTEPMFSAEAWRKCERRGVRIPKGTPVVLAFDGSKSGDSTALLMLSCSKKPHLEVAGHWDPAEHEDGWEVPILEVEDRIRQLCHEYRVREVVADPFLWQRSLAVLDEDGVPVHAFPHSNSRLTPATTELRAAVVNGLLTHSGQKALSEHMLRASVSETDRGIKIAKPTRKEHIDLAACAVMGYSRVCWLTRDKKKRARSFT